MYPIFSTKYNTEELLNWNGFIHFQIEMSQDHRHHYLHLIHGKVLADAVSRIYKNRHMLEVMLITIVQFQYSVSQKQTTSKQKQKHIRWP